MKAPPTDSPVELPPAPPPQPVPPPTVATWPQWVKSIDAAMAVLVLVAAFLVASNIARNSDQWLHYAGGRALLNGTYSFGSDPFSHVAADRVWVNHSWLAGVAMYLLYNGDPTGFVIVAVKAFLFAVTIGILLLIRRPGQSLWPWVVTAAVAVAAAAPHTGLRPYFFSGLFTAITLYILLGRDWKAGARFNVAALGVLFWVWASCDNWFVLGPIAVAAVLIGECIQNFLGRAGADDDRFPAIRQLALALAVGAVACSLTPHHVRVWQLPIETGLTLPANYQSDFETRAISLPTLNEQQYLRLTGAGWNYHGYAFLALFAGGGLALLAGFARLRAAHLVLWLAFAGLSILHTRLVLPFAIVAVPLIATAIGGLVDRIRLGAPDGPRAKLLPLLASVGRIIAFPFALIFVAAAYTGELQTRPNHKSMTPRCAWGVEPDPGLKRTAELLEGWRASGKLPDDYRGIVINFDLANHIAWFAPREKVFANGRFAHHLPELEEFIKARRIFLNRQTGEPIENVEISNFREFCQRHDVVYVVYSGITSPPARRVDTAPLYQLTSYQGNYSLWHVDGRAVVLGDRRSSRARDETFRGLAFNPIRLAFHPDAAKPVPPPKDGARPDTSEETFLDPFLKDLPKQPPLEALDAAVWNEIAVQHGESDFLMQTVAWPPLAGAVGNPVPAGIASELGYRANDVTTAYRILALRAAYTAIAENPAHADPYLVIAQSGGFGRGPSGGRPGAPASIPGLRNELKRQFEIAGLRQYLQRIPPPERAGMYESGPGYYVANWLHELYQPPSATESGQAMLADPAAWSLALALKYLPRAEMALRNPKEVEKLQKELDRELKQLELLVSRDNDRFEPFKKREIHQQIGAAIELRLFSQAKSRFEEAWPELGPDPIGTTLQMVRVYSLLGQLEEADYYLREAEAGLERLAADPKSRQQWEYLSLIAFKQRSELSQFRGDYTRAAEGIAMALVEYKLTDLEIGFARAAAARPGVREFFGYVYAPHLMAAVGGAGSFGQGELQSGVKRWQEQADIFMQAGLLLLLEGKPAEARFRFEQVLRPEKIEMPAYLPIRSIAEQYIRMIDRAAK